jgi:hypothetical protein
VFRAHWLLRHELEKTAGIPATELTSALPDLDARRQIGDVRLL